MINQITTVIWSTIDLAILWFIVSIAFRNVAVDEFRFRIFSVRDELFDYAADGHISFESPAYKLLRHRLNGYLRFGHRLSPVMVLVLIGMFHGQTGDMTKEHEAEWANACSGLQQDVVKKLNSIADNASDKAVKHLLFGVLDQTVLIVLPFALGLLVYSLALSVQRKKNYSFRKTLPRDLNTLAQI